MGLSKHFSNNISKKIDFPLINAYATRRIHEYAINVTLNQGAKATNQRRNISCVIVEMNLIDVVVVMIFVDVVEIVVIEVGSDVDVEDVADAAVSGISGGKIHY